MIKKCNDKMEPKLSTACPYMYMQVVVDITCIYRHTNKMKI